MAFGVKDHILLDEAKDNTKINEFNTEKQISINDMLKNNT
jgi:hypothetical protein